MKLSIYMIEDWLKEWNPIATIINGERNITNARLFTDNLKTEADCLYVGRVQDFFSEDTSHEILLMHDHDVISIQSDDLNYIFNQILSAFDFYNSMEEKMISGMTMQNPEQEIISTCENIIGPTFIFTNDFQIIAASQNYSNKYINDFW